MLKPPASPSLHPALTGRREANGKLGWLPLLLEGLREAPDPCSNGFVLAPLFLEGLGEAPDPCSNGRYSRRAKSVEQMRFVQAS